MKNNTNDYPKPGLQEPGTAIRGTAIRGSRSRGQVIDLFTKKIKDLSLRS